MEVAQMHLRRLRRAIQNNQVSFPSPVPAFQRESRADIQWRAVDLYFVRGWSCEKVGQRFGLTRTRTGQILASWVDRAITLGYLQEIPVQAAAAVTFMRRPAAPRVFHAATSASDALLEMVGA